MENEFIEDIMAIGFVLITVAPTMEHSVYRNLRKVNEITELYPLFGEYDFISKIESENIDELGQIVLDHIRTIKGVIQTKTLTVVVF